jgi:DNA polymerase-3 subunit epsilon
MLQTNLSDLPLVFLDVETTGLDPRYGDRVVEIALARFRGDALEAHFDSLVNPQRFISPGASQVNGITDADVEDAPLFAELAVPVLDFLADTVIVAHNAPFDMGFVASELRRARQSVPENFALDTLTLARRYFSFRSNSLGNIAAHLGIDTAGAHRALADVLTTRKVFEFFVRDWAKRAGVKTLADWLNAQGGTIPWPGDGRADLPLPPALEEALRANRKVFLRYVDGYGSESERWITPLDVFAQCDYIYVRAFCHLREAERQFRLDRVIELRLGD